MGSAHMVSLCSGVSTIRHIVSLMRERGVGTAGSGAQSFSISLQSELLLAQEVPAALDADRHLFRVELISANVYTTSKRFFTSQ